MSHRRSEVVMANVDDTLVVFGGYQVPMLLNFDTPVSYKHERFMKLAPVTSVIKISYGRKLGLFKIS